MSIKEYLIYFSASQQDRFRYFHEFLDGRIKRFAIQYEAFIQGEWHPIVRYDTAHGFPHKDILHPDGTQQKILYPHYTSEEVLTLGERDIKLNWQSYRFAYEREMK